MLWFSLALVSIFRIIHCLQDDEVLHMINVLSNRIDDLELTVRVQQQQIDILQQNNLNDVKSRNRIRRQVLATGRTCQELKSTNPELNSGYYWIDPDGVGSGDPAIRVLCNMTTGSTFIPHDSEASIPVTECSDPGCYSRNIAYNATMRQIDIIIQLSGLCRQSIRYDCVESPLEHRGVTYSWWTDRHGNKQIFWVGRNSSKHTCLCGLTRQCTNKELTCNCDAMATTLQRDNGYITDKEILPVKSVHFGKTNSASHHSIGKLECSGRSSVSGIPSSCRDLQILGHAIKGIYSIKSQNQIQSVYCDFTKVIGDPGFEQVMETSSATSSAVYFHARAAVSPTVETTTRIVTNYDKELINLGGGLNRITGIFTAPRAGVYLFSVNNHLPVCCRRAISRLFHNTNQVMVVSQGNDQNSYSSYSAILFCRSGDQVHVQANVPEAQVFATDDGTVHFMGALLSAQF